MTALLFSLWLGATPVMTQDDVSFQIGKELRCPVCQGMPISESPSEMAQSMMARVRELAAEGKSEREIKDYFVERYGEWVLLAPERQGFNWVVWVLPPLALVLALGFVVRASKLSAAAPSPAVPPSQPSSEDPYILAVRKAVDDNLGDA